MLSRIPLPFTLHLPYLGMDLDTVSSFSLMAVAAFLSAGYTVPKELIRRGLRTEVTNQILQIAVVGTVLGAKLGFVLEVWREIWIRHTMTVAEAFFSQGGLVFYGGFLVSFFLIYLYLRLKELPIWNYMDALVPALAMGYGIGRLGCMVSGDGCYGYASPISLPPLSMAFGANSIVSTEGVEVWNTPLMEALASFALYYLLAHSWRARTFRPGMFSALFLVYNGFARFLVEFLRLNDALIPLFPHPTFVDLQGKEHPLSYEAAVEFGRGAAYYFRHWRWYGFTQSQVAGIALAMIGILWMWKGKLHREADIKDDTERGEI